MLKNGAGAFITTPQGSIAAASAALQLLPHHAVRMYFVILFGYMVWLICHDSTCAYHT